MARPSASHAASDGYPISWAVRLTVDEVPAEILGQARLCLLDLAGVAAAGHRTQMGAIAREFASAQFSGRAARMLFDGRLVSVAGATFAGADMLDAFDAHNGHALTKGHAGAAILPTPLSPDQLRTEFHALAAPLPAARRAAIEAEVMATAPGRPVATLPTRLLERA